MERISTGNQELDYILCGGFPRSSINIILGRPGSGKTILAQQIAFANAGADRPVLYLSTLSEPLSKIVTYLQEFSFADIGMIGSGVIYESLTEDLSKEPSSLADIMLELLKQYRPSVIVIDSFKAIADLMPDVQSWRRVVFELAGVLTAYDATSFWVGEYGTLEDPGRVEFAIADSVIELNRKQMGSRDERYLRVAKLRGSGFKDGNHSFSIDIDGLRFYPRLVAPKNIESYELPAERLRSGIGGLDEMIESGWLRGSSTLVVGPSGSGKTVLGLHFLRQGVADGEPGLLVNFQENPIQLARMMRSLGWSTDDVLGPGKLDVLYSSPIEMQIDAIVQEVLRRIRLQGVRRVVVDALADLERSADDPSRFRDYIYALTQHFSALNVTAMLMLESGTKTSAGETGKEVSFMSDNIVLLSMEMEQDLTRSIRIVKSRGSAHDGKKHVLTIGSEGMVVG